MYNTQFAKFRGEAELRFCLPRRQIHPRHVIALSKYAHLACHEITHPAALPMKRRAATASASVSLFHELPEEIVQDILGRMRNPLQLFQMRALCDLFFRLIPRSCFVVNLSDLHQFEPPQMELILSVLPNIREVQVPGGYPDECMVKLDEFLATWPGESLHAITLGAADSHHVSKVLLRHRRTLTRLTIHLSWGNCCEMFSQLFGDVAGGAFCPTLVDVTIYYESRLPLQVFRSHPMSHCPVKNLTWCPNGDKLEFPPVRDTFTWPALQTVTVNGERLL